MIISVTLSQNVQLGNQWTPKSNGDGAQGTHQLLKPVPTLTIPSETEEVSRLLRREPETKRHGDFASAFVNHVNNCYLAIL